MAHTPLWLVVVNLVSGLLVQNYMLFCLFVCSFVCFCLVSFGGFILFYFFIFLIVFEQTINVLVYALMV